MATVMAECLENVARTNRIEPNEIPVGVYWDALEFSGLALQATGDAVPDNPPASINAYVIAADALRRSSRDLPRTREDIDHRLEEYAGFLRTLETPRELNQKESETVKSLRTFFSRLKEEGESEAYEKAVYLEPVPMGFPFL
jgi:hypothetical protein